MGSPNDEREAVLKRLQALLEMKTERGASEAEMQVAMAMAQRIALKHRINLEDLKRGEQGVTDTLISKTHRTLDMDTVIHIRRILTRYFGVHIIGVQGEPEIKIIGTPTDVDFSIYAYNFLRQTFKRLWFTYKMEEEATKWSQGKLLLWSISRTG